MMLRLRPAVASCGGGLPAGQGTDRGTHRVADGDLDYRLPVRSDDELGDLAASFNKMTAEVAGVHAKIEEQVRRKTAELERRPSARCCSSRRWPPSASWRPRWRTRSTTRCSAS
jgi:hypothetical protein